MKTWVKVLIVILIIALVIVTVTWIGKEKKLIDRKRLIDFITLKRIKDEKFTLNPPIEKKDKDGIISSYVSNYLSGEGMN